MAKDLVEWSRSVRARDGKCMKCGREEDLHAHHVLPKSTHPELKLDIGNGVTLCYSCHKREHEENRPIRIRSNSPRRGTLQKKISSLESQLLDAELRSQKIVSLLEAEISVLRRQNERLISDLDEVCEKINRKAPVVQPRYLIDRL